jgi:hypothetical protein
MNYISSKEIDKESVLVQADDMTYFEVTSTNIVSGLSWDTTSDEFVFRFDNLLSKCCSMTLTKRNILSVSASIFDPLGMLAPVTAKLKSLFQLLCKDKLDWDDVIPKELEEIWGKIIGDLKLLN